MIQDPGGRANIVLPCQATQAKNENPWRRSPVHSATGRATSVPIILRYPTPPFAGCSLSHRMSVRGTASEGLVLARYAPYATGIKNEGFYSIVCARGLDLLRGPPKAQHKDVTDFPVCACQGRHKTLHA